MLLHPSPKLLPAVLLPPLYDAETDIVVWPTTSPEQLATDPTGWPSIRTEVPEGLWPLAVGQIVRFTNEDRPAWTGYIGTDGLPHHLALDESGRPQENPPAEVGKYLSWIAMWAAAARRAGSVTQDVGVEILEPLVLRPRASGGHRATGRHHAPKHGRHRKP